MQKILNFRAIFALFLIKLSMRNSLIDIFDSFYFIGIGGVSMSGLAKYLIYRGKKVCGSDLVSSVYTDELVYSGVNVKVGKVADSVKNFDVIVYTDAVPENNVQLKEAKKLDKIILSRGQLLYEISRGFSNVIAISGCHGKTTCTSMLAHIFLAAGKKFFAHIGGRDIVFANSFFCGTDYLITEACEYKKNFLLLKPNIAVLLNSGTDHLECYGSIENLRAAYRQFVKNADLSITLGGDETVGAVTFGYGKNVDFCAKNISSSDGRFSFTMYEGNRRLGRVSLSVDGKHNVLNALAAACVALNVGISFRYVQEGLADFCGVERRFERIGAIGGARCIADYAHHPDEIVAALKTTKSTTKGKIYVVFQPHTYSRTKLLFKEFVKVLSQVDNLLIYRTFAAREYFDDAGSALTLSQSIKKSLYGDDPKDIVNFISPVKSGDCILFLGAGDIYDISKQIVSELS